MYERKRAALARQAMLPMAKILGDITEVRVYQGYICMYVCIHIGIR